MTKGFYTMPTGETIEVLDFDPINKMVYVPLANGSFAWVHDNVYSAWQKVGEECIETLPEEAAAEIIVEEPKKKRTTKKKDA